MKRLLCVLLAVCSALVPGLTPSGYCAGPARTAFIASRNPSGDILSAFASRIASGCASFSYSFVMTSGSAQSGKLVGEGTLCFQGGSYHLQGNGLEVWCDGSSIWTADRTSKEVVIETVSEDVLVNPALILADISGHFSWEPVPRSGMFSSQSSQVFLLRPLSKSGVQSLELFFDSKGVELLGGRMLSADNVSATFFISGLTVSEFRDASFFTPPAFPAEWIVTDLR